MFKFGRWTMLLFLLSVTINGQTSNEEINRLRALLKLPASTALMTEPISPELPKDRVIKVFVASEQDKKVNRRVTDWVNEWNQEEGSKYEQLRVVSSLSEADLILAFLKVRERVPQTRTALRVGSVFDPSRGVSKSRDPKVRADTYFPIARYTYLITRPADNHPLDTLQILYGETDRSHIRDYSDPDKHLFKELVKKIKNR